MMIHPRWIWTVRDPGLIIPFAGMTMDMVEEKSIFTHIQGQNLYEFKENIQKYKVIAAPLSSGIPQVDIFDPVTPRKIFPLC